MDEEYNTLMENQTWDLVPLLKGRNLVRCRWTFQTKMAANGEISKYKSQLVAKGYSQVHDIDYTETFALVIASFGHCGFSTLEVHHMDVKSDFLHRDI
jgi:hypothetical protein